MPSLAPTSPAPQAQAHTPGPFKAYHYDDGSTVAANSGNLRLAENIRNPGDAKLFAAAPGLLKALKSSLLSTKST